MILIYFYYEIYIFYKMKLMIFDMLMLYYVDDDF